MRGDASEGPLATLADPAGRSHRALSSLWPAGDDPVDAPSRRPDEAGLSHVGLHGVPADRGTSRTRV